MEETIKFISTIFGILSLTVILVIRFEIRFNRISTRLTALEQKIEPFWEIVKTNLTKLFTENPSKVLLDKLNDIEILTIDEIQGVEEQFKEEMEVADPSKRINYLLVLWRLEIAKKDRSI